MSSRYLVFGLAAFLLVGGVTFYFTQGDALQGSFGGIEIKGYDNPVNEASSKDEDFTNSGPTGKFATMDALTLTTSQGVDNTAHIRETSTGVNQAGITYTFDSTVDLSAYKGISFFTRSSENKNTITLTLDGIGTDYACKTGALSMDKWTYKECSFSGTTADLTTISELSFTITDGSAMNAEWYGLDRITLRK